jgi:transposase
VSTVELVHPRCAGLDVAKDEVVACVRVPDGDGGRAQEVRTFPTFTSGLEALAGWLAAEGVTQVVMEVTSDYWKPVVRHEVSRVWVEVKGLRLRPVAAGR